ncbi:hypothetical protein QVD17_22467 [Tagetes erecta]|uniref:Uncharacterized protein n=1 Tax=Tagetes erecta TaxID=13708 RepID=A0AAD8NU16_TARER|nr:hypothetical protein QVD17_22467 [Tagetes erecta]
MPHQCSGSLFSSLLNFFCIITITLTCPLWSEISDLELAVDILHACNLLICLCQCQENVMANLLWKDEPSERFF